MARSLNLKIFSIILTIVASIFSIILAWQTWYGPASADGKFALKVFAIFIVILAFFLVIQEYRYSRKARYAEALGDLNKIFGEIQSLACNATATMTEIQTGCKSIVNCLSSVFSLISGTRCAVCIKTIENISSEHRHPKVVTLTRDDKSVERELGGARIDHWIDQNTDFEKLDIEPLAYFFSNYLPGIRGYKNTSFKIYKEPKDIGIPLISDVVRDLTWTLPYKSTIVMPIFRINPQPSERRLVGYLCVDSRSRGAFSRRYDIELLKGISDCLYNLVRRHIEMSWASTKRSN